MRASFINDMSSFTQSQPIRPHKSRLLAFAGRRTLMAYGDGSIGIHLDAFG